MTKLRIICAIGEASESKALAEALRSGIPGSDLSFPSSLPEIEGLLSTDAADVIVTDFRFLGGALADWLALWPLPAVLIADPLVSTERIGQSLKDEAALLLEKREDGSHLARLPLLVRKAVDIRESVSRQNAHLKITERQYYNLLRAIPDIVYSLDEHGRFLYLNDATRELGFEPAELLGRHFSEILEPEDVAAVSRDKVLDSLRGQVTGAEGAPKLFDERRSGERMTRNLEVRLRIADRERRYGSVYAYGEIASAGFHVPEFEGQGLGTVGIIRDITVRKRHERELEELLRSREALLREIHHRVNNNLQLISSLMHIEERSIRGEDELEIFTEVQTQIESMAFVHELFWSQGSLDLVEMQPVGERICANLLEARKAVHRGVAVSVNARGVRLDLDTAIVVGLVANELVSNSLVHAWPEGGRGRVELSLSAAGAELLLSVSDDGVGALAAARGVGTDLVEALASQVRGSLSKGPGLGGKGRSTTLRFPARAAQGGGEG